jgi:hypothetical protein
MNDKVATVELKQSLEESKVWPVPAASFVDEVEGISHGVVSCELRS